MVETIALLTRTAPTSSLCWINCNLHLMTASRENNGRGGVALVFVLHPDQPCSWWRATSRGLSHLHQSKPQYSLMSWSKTICKLGASVTNLKIDSWHCYQPQYVVAHIMVWWVIGAWNKTTKHMEISFPWANCAVWMETTNCRREVLWLNKAVAEAHDACRADNARWWGQLISGRVEGNGDESQDDSRCGKSGNVSTKQVRMVQGH